ncbi:MAG: DUF3800 domain-containing protein [Solibacillus isronensis]
MQELHIYIDDSGVFHKNNKYFVYAGYVFLSASEKEVAKRKYKKLVTQIKKAENIEGELKGCNLPRKHKRALFNVFKEYESFFVVVTNEDVRESIMEVPKSRHRFKDYVLKRIIKEKVKYFIRNNKIDPYKPLRINMCVDQQLTASDGYYDLKSSIIEELVTGVSNFNYQMTFNPILFGGLEINLTFCDSSSNYLIQASDIFANRVHASLVLNKPDLRRKKNNTNLYLP